MPKLGLPPLSVCIIVSCLYSLLNKRFAAKRFSSKKPPMLYWCQKWPKMTTLQRIRRTHWAAAMAQSGARILYSKTLDEATLCHVCALEMARKQEVAVSAIPILQPRQDPGLTPQPRQDWGLGVAACLGYVGDSHAGTFRTGHHPRLRREPGCLPRRSSPGCLEWVTYLPWHQTRRACAPSVCPGFAARATPVAHPSKSTQFPGSSRGWAVP